MKTLNGVAKCSDFFDEECNKNLIMDEYITNFLRENGIKLEEVFINKMFMNELIKILLKSTHINKRDIQNKLGISWKIVNSVMEKM